MSQYNDARPKNRSPNRGKNWYPGRITVPANLVFRLNIWGARDNGIPPRSTPELLYVAVSIDIPYNYYICTLYLLYMYVAHKIYLTFGN